MDLASTLRVLGKHKLVVGTLLALTLAATAISFSVASKTQQATGSYLLLNARTPPEQPDGTTEPTNNPFATMDLSTVVDILVRAEMTEQVMQELVSQGFVGTFKVEGNKDFNRGPVIDLTVTSPTAEEALAGYELLAEDVQLELRDRQLAEGANPDYLLGVQRLQEPVVTSPGLVSRLRMTIAIFGVGIIFTIGFTLALDSIQKAMRARREANRASEAGESTAPLATGDDEGPGDAGDAGETGGINGNGSHDAAEGAGHPPKNRRGTAARQRR